MSDFLKCVICTFVVEANRKHDRFGHLFQDRYKARLITTDADLLYIARYIHQNAWDAGENILTYQYSSMRFYLDVRYKGIVNVKDLLSFFDGSREELIKFTSTPPTILSII